MIFFKHSSKLEFEREKWGKEGEKRGREEIKGRKGGGGRNVKEGKRT